MVVREIENRVPVDYELLVARVGFLYGYTRDQVLNGLTFNQLKMYAEEGHYWKLSELGIKFKRPSTHEQVENEKERQAQLKIQYIEARNKAGK